MQFSIRFLLELTLFIAIVATAVVQTRDVIRLEQELQLRKATYARLAKTLSRKNPIHVHKLINIYQEALPEYETSSALYLTAKQRFERMQQAGASSD